MFFFHFLAAVNRIAYHFVWVDFNYVSLKLIDLRDSLTHHYAMRKFHSSFPGLQLAVGLQKLGRRKNRYLLPFDSSCRAEDLQ